jgi:GT2 family glycosyltransferase
VTKSWLKPLAQVAAADPKTGIMGPVFWEWETDSPNYYMQGRCPEVIECMLDQNHAPFNKDWIEGSSFFIRKECFEQIGGFDPLYFMYWEDAEYCRRARYFGWRVSIVPGSLCRHHAKGSAADLGPGFFELRNHFLFKMTDPSSDYMKNVLLAIRLGITHLKHSLAPPNGKLVAELLQAGCSASLFFNRCRRRRLAIRLAKEMAGAGETVHAS